MRMRMRGWCTFNGQRLYLRKIKGLFGRDLWLPNQIDDNGELICDNPIPPVGFAFVVENGEIQQRQRTIGHYSDLVFEGVSC